MSATVSGSYTSAVGANRVRIPAKYRSFLGEKFYATVGNGGCLMLIPLDNKDGLIGNYTTIDDPYMSDRIKLARTVNELTEEVELDNQGRMTTSDKIKKICTGLKQPTEAIVFSGMGKYIEAWPKQVHDKLFGDVTSDDFDVLIANLKAQLGIED